MFKFSKSSIKNMEGVHPDLQLIFKTALAVSPIDFGVPSTGGVRTAEAQHELFLKGASKCDGYNKLSNHQLQDGQEFGKAIDVYAFVNGRASWDKKHLGIVAGAILSVAEILKKEGKISSSIVWGGTFGRNGKNLHGWDFPHYEIGEVK